MTAKQPEQPIIGFDPAHADNQTVIVMLCATCTAMLRPDHREGEACPVCETPVFFVLKQEK